MMDHAKRQDRSSGMLQDGTARNKPVFNERWKRDGLG